MSPARSGALRGSRVPGGLTGYFIGPGSLHWDVPIGTSAGLLVRTKGIVLAAAVTG
jgi:hypothetical protein